MLGEASPLTEHTEHFGVAFTLQSMAIFRGSFITFEGSFFAFRGRNRPCNCFPVSWTLMGGGGQGAHVPPPQIFKGGGGGHIYQFMSPHDFWVVWLFIEIRMVRPFYSCELSGARCVSPPPPPPFCFACQRGWWCTVGTPPLCLENFEVGIFFWIPPPPPPAHPSHQLFPGLRDSWRRTVTDR